MVLIVRVDIVRNKSSEENPTCWLLLSAWSFLINTVHCRHGRTSSVPSVYVDTIISS